MTLFAATRRRRPTSPTYTVPVVRELAPQTTQVAVGSAW